MKKVAIITPTYNEQKNIDKLIEEIFTVEKETEKWEFYLVVVDSHSPDGTANKIKALQKKYPRLFLIEMEKKGLGRAYVEGYRFVFEKINPYLIIQMDADLSHQPKYITDFLITIEKGSDFVLGSRYIKGGAIPKDWAWYRKLFSFLGNLIIRIGFANFKITDWTSGFRAIKSWVIKEIISETQKYSGYVYQIATVDQALKKGARLTEVPIRFIDRRFGTSKISFSQYIFDIFFYLFFNSSFIKFFIVGMIGFIIDFSFAYFLINKFYLNKPLSNMISAEIAIISNFILNNFWSFKEKRIRGSLIKYFYKFLIFNFISSGSILIQGLGLNLSLNLFGDRLISILNYKIQSWIVYKIFIIGFIIIPYSFFLYNRVIWRKR